MPALSVSKLWPRTDRLWSARGGEDEIAPSIFNLTITATVLYALVIFAWMGEEMVTVIRRGRFRLHVWELIGIFLVLAAGAIAGHLVALSTRPAKACIGLGVSAACFGAFSGPFFNQYGASSIMHVGFATLVITVLLGAVGIIYPKSLKSWHAPLCTAVVGLIVLQLSGAFIPGISGAPLRSIAEWISVLTFSAYVIYDFNRAQQIPRTTANAVQAGAAVFLDIINLFADLLRLMGSKKEEDGTAA